jgi:hypothetical protein
VEPSLSVAFVSSALLQLLQQTITRHRNFARDQLIPA